MGGELVALASVSRSGGEVMPTSRGVREGWVRIVSRSVSIQ